LKIKSIVVCISLMGIPFSGYAGDYLNGDQIKKTFSGKTIQWEHMFKSKSGKSYYAEDGSLTGVQNGSKREGKWHVDGNRLCVSWGSCLAIEADGNGGFYKVKGGSKQVVHIKALSEGNTL